MRTGHTQVRPTVTRNDRNPFADFVCLSLSDFRLLAFVTWESGGCVNSLMCCDVVMCDVCLHFGGKCSTVHVWLCMVV